MDADVIWLIISVYIVVGSGVLSARFPTPLTKAGVLLTVVAGTWACLNVLASALRVADIDVPLFLVFALGATSPLFMVWLFTASPCRWMRSSMFIRKPGVYYNRSAGKPLVRAR